MPKKSDVTALARDTHDDGQFKIAGQVEMALTA
jgi:hypothetical protein